MKNSWDSLSKKFDTHISDEIDPDAADNILIAWPPIIKFILKHFPNRDNKSLRALDYGCGTGGFTRKLASLGFHATGADSSKGMLAVARQTNSDISFVVPDEILQGARFDLITGIMVFQFVEDIETLFSKLVSQLTENGLVVFAVFNPEFVAACLKAETSFADFDSVKHPQQGNTLFGDSRIPTFIRTTEQYNAMMKKLGMKKQLEEYPPFTSEFLAKYSVDFPTEIPEYLILGYSKLSNS